MPTRYGYMDDRTGLVGGLDGTDHKLGSVIAGGAVAQVDTITIGGSTAGVHTHTVTLEDGTVETISYTSAAGGAAADVTLCVAAFVANALVSGVLLATDGAGNTVVLTARTAGIGWTLAETADPGSDTSIANTTANADAGAIAPGRAVVAVVGSDTLGKHPLDTDYAVQVTTVTPVGAISGEHFQVVVTADFDQTGIPYPMSFGTGAAASAAALIDELELAMNTQFPTSSIVVTQSATVLTLTSERRGLKFEVSATSTDEGGSTAAASVSIATSTAAALLDFKGVAVNLGSRALTTAAATSNTYPGGSSATTCKRGRIWVELEAGETPAPASPVFVRMNIAGGGTEAYGAFRASADAADCYILPSGKGAWVENTARTGAAGTRIALLELF
jgi:hypothetical protein